MENHFVHHYNLRGEMDTLRYASVPGGVFEARTYNEDGALVRHVVSGNRRDATFKYDARQKVLWSANQFGASDTLMAAYSGLGYLLTSRLSGWGETTTGAIGRAEAFDTMSYDALGNIIRTRSIRSQNVGNGLPSSSSTNRVNAYELETGRLDSVFDYGKFNHDKLIYDSAGSVTAMVQSAVGTGGLENRITYYGADGSVRAADYRRFDGDPQLSGPNRFVFEEYRFDAYGRRVWVRARRECDGITNQTDDRPRGECRTDLVRRTVWDGFQELAEIQQPGGDADPVENDTTPLQRGYPDGIDQNPFIGRVLYTYGAVLDQPLSLVRVGYAETFASTATPQPWFMWQPFSILPLWNYLGEVDRSLVGAGAPLCQLVNGVQRCVLGAWPFGWNALQVSGFAPYFWHGTVTENKRDKAQTLYKRYRLYDPLTGRFTQEDPIGLAGGLNLYGFAAGDPVTFSDPFGLCVKDDADCQKIVAQLRAQEGAEFRAAADRYDALRDRRVHLVRKSHPGLGDDERLNGDGDPETWVGGNVTADAVYLNKSLSRGDLLITAVHESYHFGEGLNEGVQADVNRIALAEYSAYSQLSPQLRATATRHSDRFFHWWGPRFGSHPVRAREAPYPTGERY